MVFAVSGVAPELKQLFEQSHLIEVAPFPHGMDETLCRCKVVRLPTTEIERLCLGTWSSPVAVILKAIGFHLATIEALYRARLSAGDPIRDDLTRTKAEFIALSRPTAERIVRFYRSRRLVEFTARRT